MLKIGRRNFLIFFFSIFLSSTEQTVWEGGVIHKIFEPIENRVSPNRVGRANTYNTSRHFFIRERTINNERFYQISRKSNTNFILLKSILCNCFCGIRPGLLRSVMSTDAQKPSAQRAAILSLSHMFTLPSSMG